MLTETKLEKAFQDTIKKSKKECGEEIEKIRQLIADVNTCFWKIEETNKGTIQKFVNSLVYSCYVELVRLSSHSLYLSSCGLYRNAFDNVRYILESIVQAFYIDTRHRETDLKTKVEILKEVEDKREYHASRLIDELEIDPKLARYKNTLKRQYKELSKIIHPSHKQVIATWSDVLKERGVPVTIDCEEISRIYDSMRRVYDIVFFLYIIYFPHVRKLLAKDSDFNKCVKNHKLALLSKVINVPQRKSSN